MGCSVLWKSLPPVGPTLRKSSYEVCHLKNLCGGGRGAACQPISVLWLGKERSFVCLSCIVRILPFTQVLIFQNHAVAVPGRLAPMSH